MSVSSRGRGAAPSLQKGFMWDTPPACSLGDEVMSREKKNERVFARTGRCPVPTKRVYVGHATGVFSRGRGNVMEKKNVRALARVSQCPIPTENEFV
jgi:hypothetical protein